ncbi:MAG: VOC family protein, partial [Ignavibacteria bacterium]
MRFTEIELLTNKFSELKEFYSENLDLTIAGKTQNSFTVRIGTTGLKFRKNIGPVNPYYHFAINIPENQINEAKKWLSGKAEILKDNGNEIIDFKNWNAHSVYFYDPAGNIVELIARHNLPNNSNSDFNSSSLLCISEIGMPVENVSSFYKIIEEKLNEKIWSGNRETFAAVGDEHGLFIIVPNKRNWYPTDKESRIFPLTIKFKSGKEEIITFSGLP